MRFLLALLALAFSASTFAAPARTLKVTETAQGGFVLGNPKATTRLVEYMSFTCPHCAHFTTEAATPLKRDYVAKGVVAYEVRNAVRDGYDMAAALLAHCGGAPSFFGNMEAIFGAQLDWMAKIETMDKTALAGKSNPEAMALIAQGSGLNDIMRKRGFTTKQLNLCLENKVSLKKILAMTNDAWDVRKIPGTPAFFINDKLAESTTTWEALEPKLKLTTNPPSAKPEVK